MRKNFFGKDARVSMRLLLVALGLVVILGQARADVTGKEVVSYIQNVTPAQTVTTLAVPSGSAFVSSNVKLVVNVVSVVGSPAVNGQAVISDGATALQIIPIVNGTASVTENFSANGVHQLSACFVSEQNFLASCSSVFSLNALPPFTLAQSSPTGTWTSKTPFVDTVSVIPATGFAGVVQLTCVVQQGSCKVTPSSVTFTGSTGTQNVAAAFTPEIAATASISLVCAALFCLICFTTRRKRFVRMLQVAGGAAALVGMVGCHALSLPLSESTSTMTVTATNGTYSQSVVSQITIQQ